MSDTLTAMASQGAKERCISVDLRSARQREPTTRSDEACDDATFADA